jgi:transcriptional regulator with GAF, ATPase, and Fis domain
VLQEKEIMRIGGNKTIKTDFRLIAATNKDLQKLTEQGLFRSDLYFRLSVLPIEIPPLRSRKADIPAIAQFLAEKHCAEMGLPGCEITADIMARLMEYEWPGNVRELENVIQRGILLARDGKLVLEDLECRSSAAWEKDETFLPLREMERKYIRKVLRHCGGRISGEGGAADLLGLKRTTLISRMKKLGIKN